jgi:hypothetical protein
MLISFAILGLAAALQGQPALRGELVPTLPPIAAPKETQAQAQPAAAPKKPDKTPVKKKAPEKKAPEKKIPEKKAGEKKKPAPAKAPVALKPEAAPAAAKEAQTGDLAPTSPDQAPPPVRKKAAKPAPAPRKPAQEEAQPAATADPTVVKAASHPAPPAAEEAPPAVVSTGDDASEIPPGAPTDDYGLVAWCQGALNGHMALYNLVKPQLDALEAERDPKESAELDAEQFKAGQDYLALYARAIQAADDATAGAQHARGEQLKLEGDHIWAAARGATPNTRMWSWIMWELPPRCEIAARRLERDSGLLGAVMKPRKANPGSDPK